MPSGAIGLNYILHTGLCRAAYILEWKGLCSDGRYFRWGGGGGVFPCDHGLPLLYSVILSLFIIDSIALAKQVSRGIMHLVASVRLSIRLDVCLCSPVGITLKFGARDDCHLFDECLCVCNQGALVDNFHLSRPTIPLK